MACNGHNHSPYCNCGWGGGNRGYKNPRPKTKKSTKIIKKNNRKYNYIPKIETYKSFTVPNVQCNCCGQKIFFYQSPYEGKVFFEELGPPWKKHCCEPQCCKSSKKNIPKPIEKHINIDKKSTWERRKWIPCIIISETIINTHINKVTVKSVVDMNQYIFFIQKNFFKFNFRKGFIISLKKQNELKYEISFYLKKEYNIFVNRDANQYYLQFDKFINNSFNSLQDKNISLIKLATLFFQTFNIKSFDVNKKEQLLNAIIEHPNSNKFEMNEVFYFIKNQGFNKFKINIIKNYKFYNKSTIDFLISLDNIYIPMKLKQSLIRQGKIQLFLIKVNKLKWTSSKINYTLKHYQYQFNLLKIIFIFKKRKNRSNLKKRKVNLYSKINPTEQTIVKKIKDKSNLRPNRNGWKGIMINDPKKIKLTFIEKDNDL